MHSWEQRKLGDIASLITKGTTPKDKSGVGEVNFVKVENINPDNGEITNTSQISLKEHEGYLKRSQLKENDILFSIAGTLGRVSTVKSSVLPANTNQALAIIRLCEGVIEYVTTVLKGKAVEDFIKRNPTVGAQPNLSLEQVNNLEIPFPSNEEQQKIGAYFEAVDHLITLHQRKHLGWLKVGKNAWEQRKAIDIADYLKGNGYSKGDLTDAGTPIILYGRLYTKYQFAISEVDTFAVPRNGAVYSQGNEVIVPASGETAEDIARASAVEKSGVLLGGDLNILRPFDFINPLFLALAISNGEPQKELAKKAQGKSVVHIHNTDIQEVTIAYPSRTEQDRIVSVFCNLDHLITLHQQQCDDLKNLKKYMLQNMFI